MRKAVLNPNTLPVNKQEFQVEGFTYANRILQRDSINVELGQIERPDKTIVPSGRTEPGEFNITLDAADNAARNGYYAWWLLARDQFSDIALGMNDVVSGADLYGFNYGNYSEGSNPYATASSNSRVGIAANYKRKAVITMHRLYIQDVNGAASVDSTFGTNNSVRIVLHGCWCKTLEFGEFDMESDEAATITCGISYDDAQLIVDP